MKDADDKSVEKELIVAVLAAFIILSAGFWILRPSLTGYSVLNETNASNSSSINISGNASGNWTNSTEVNISLEANVSGSILQKTTQTAARETVRIVLCLFWESLLY